MPRVEPVSAASLAIAALSTVVEWYDFTLYLYLATVLSRVFFDGHGASDAGSGDGVRFALLNFALAYLVRPVGAIVFGRLGDRQGRRRALMLSMGLMTVSMVLTALLPTRAQAGAVAGWSLLGLRCLMSFSVGGEYNGVVTYLLEGARARRRGLIASLASAASEMGGLVAVAVCACTVQWLPQPALDAWGWRVPFAVGAALAAVLWLARAQMAESPEFERQQSANSVPKNPLRHTVRRHWRGILTGFAISALGSVTYYVGLTYVPTFLVTEAALSEARALRLSIVASGVAIAISPLVGALSDRYGRRPILIVLALAAIVLPMLSFQALSGGEQNAVLLHSCLLAAVAGGVSAVGAVATAELLPGEGRLSGLALGATGATTLFGGFAPWLAHTLTEQFHTAAAPGAFIAATALLVLPLLLGAKAHPAN